MRLSEITAQSFRNLSPGPVFFGDGVTLVAGENAQGKTNLLEAVALLCGQRSFRRARPADMAADGRGFRITGRIHRGSETDELSVEWSLGVGRQFTRAGKTVSFREVSTLAPAVFLCPEHRELVGGPPALRRRFLDRLVLGARPAAGDDLLRYQRALAERNALLSRGREEEASAGEMEAWTEELVRAGAAVRRHRREALERWLELFRPLAREAGPEYASISIDYAAQGETEEDLRMACARLLPAERRCGYTLAGPHRDDLAWTRRGQRLASCASAGEVHRVVALAKLAEWRTVERGLGEPPLLGVDEFDAGLSVEWVEAFLESLPQGGTVLLTTVSDPSRWRAFARRVLELRGGRVVARPRAVTG